MREFATAFSISLGVYLLLDAAYLGTFASSVYKPMLQAVQGSPVEFRWLPALAAWSAMSVGSAAIVVSRKGATPGVHPAVTGALYGFAVYATYNMTNMATLKEWKAMPSLADTAWGTVASSGAVYAASRAIE